jgi:hypothetical protein
MYWGSACKELAVDRHSFGLADPASGPVCVDGYCVESDPAYAAAQAVDEGRMYGNEFRSSSPLDNASEIGTGILDDSDSHFMRKSINERLAEFSTSVSTWYDLTARPALVSLGETIRPWAIEAWTHGPSLLRQGALGTLRTVESISRSLRELLDDHGESESIRLFFSEEARRKYGEVKDLVLVTSGPTEAGGSKLHFSRPQSQETRCDTAIPKLGS